jgi:tetratricopeptide (TPR) repeat protein
MRRLSRNAVVLVLATLLWGSAVRAQSAPSPAAEASRHFNRAVELYNDGDLRGALIEFKKAYALLPRASVLYDIGQTQYQMQDYAQALQTLERYLSETGPNAVHRAEVQETVQVLRGRVGRIALTADRSECEVTLDDQAAGTTPLAQPLLVSIGRRRIGVTCAGMQRVVREIEVTAGETVPLDFKVGASVAPPTVGPQAMLSSAPPADTHKAGRRSTVIAWAITAVLAGTAVGLYTGAILESRNLDDLRTTFGTSSTTLDDKLRLTSRLALAGDIVAGATVVAAAVSTYLWYGSRPERGVQVGLTATGGLVVNGTF